MNDLLKDLDKEDIPQHLEFPFIPCKYTKHNRFGPQTVVTHYLKDPNKNKISLICNTCLKSIKNK